MARRSVNWVRVAILGMIGAAGAGGLYLLATVPPASDTFYPKCTLHQATGLHCPGCGATRAAHALLNGRIAQSFAYHPFAAVLFPAAVWIAARSRRRGRRTHVAPRPRWDAVWPWLVVAALVAFTVTRNLPWYPFTLLAPHEL